MYESFKEQTLGMESLAKCRFCLLVPHPDEVHQLFMSTPLTRLYSSEMSKELAEEAQVIPPTIQGRDQQPIHLSRLSHLIPSYVQR